MTLIKRTNGFYPTFHNVFDDIWANNWLLPVKEYTKATVPAVNVQETENDYKIEVAAPGYVKEDFSITIEDEILTISVEKKDENFEEKDAYSRKEFSYTSFTRKFNTPKDIVDSDRIEANYENGILNITIPKQEKAKPKPAKTIEIH